MTDSNEPQGSFLKELFDLTNAGTALVAAAIADQQLQDAILLKMRKLNRDMRDRLFDGYGPLSSFSAKIDLAFAIELIDTPTYKRLTMLRQVRNAFAHPDEMRMTFESEAILKLLAPLRSAADADDEPQAFFLSQVGEIEQSLVKAAGPTIIKPGRRI